MTENETTVLSRKSFSNSISRFQEHQYGYFLDKFSGFNPEREPVASHFSSWVFRTWHGRDFIGSNENNLRISQKIGSQAEFDIDDYFYNLATSENKNYTSKNWRVIYKDGGENKGVILKASKLSIDNEPIRCKPDVVLAHNQTGEILIIERKVTRTPDQRIPHGGWPNLQVQLWCYSWIDNWLNAPEVFLAGEIWLKESNDDLDYIRSSRCPKSCRSDKDFNLYCGKYFELYGGKIKGD